MKQIIKFWKKYKTFKKKNIENIPNSKFMQIFPLCWYKEVL